MISENRLRPFISGDMLKIIAAVTMLTDHIGAAVLWTLLQSGALRTAEYAGLQQMYHIFRDIGRTAFPIYAFLLAEGFFHTGDRKKYLYRMALFFILSEIPFDMAIYGKLTFGKQNIFLTLLIGLVVLCGLEKAKAVRNGGVWAAGTDISVWEIGISALGCAAAGILHSDYGAYGVLLIVLFYETGRMERCLIRDRYRQISGFRTAACVMGYLLFLWEPWCITGFLLLLFYNGKRKQKSRGVKYFFYFFYPVHLSILALIRVAFLRG